MIDEQWQKARRILAVRLDNLGDVLVTTPALHAIKASLPRASLTLLASPVGRRPLRLTLLRGGALRHSDVIVGRTA